MRHMLCVGSFPLAPPISTRSPLIWSLSAPVYEIAYYIDYFPFRLIRMRLFFPLSFNFPLLLSSYCLLCSSFRFQLNLFICNSQLRILESLKPILCVCVVFFFVIESLGCWFHLDFGILSAAPISLSSSWFGLFHSASMSRLLVCTMYVKAAILSL